ncbi:MAG: hypothetical protein R3C52_01285 [Hyphomonadaceae bacterium]
MGGVQAPPIALLFVSYDANHDLRVSSAEVMSAVEGEWRSADADGDGEVSAFEYDEWALRTLGSAEAEPQRIMFDVDLDAKITLDEFRARIGDLFAQLDRNRDGVLERTDLVVVRPMQRMDGPGGGGGRPQGRRGGGGSPPGGSPPPG